MSPKPPRLTATLIQEIATLLHGGAFEQVAVESQGVPFAVYQEWLRRGRRKGSRGLVRQLALRVMQAKADARVVPETKLREDDAKVWLLHGPGRDTPDQAGWGTAARRRSGDWRMTRRPSFARGGDRLAHATTRLTAGFEYVGPALTPILARTLLGR